MKVTKLQVEQIVVEIGGKVYALDRDTANELWQALGVAIGKPQIEYKGCNNRYSHSGHAWGQRDQFYCTGRSFDAT